MQPEIPALGFQRSIKPFDIAQMPLPIAFYYKSFESRQGLDRQGLIDRRMKGYSTPYLKAMHGIEKAYPILGEPKSGV